MEIFLDLDWLRKGSSKLIVISHGLEGSTERYYVRRSAKFFNALGFDILAWNNRGCSGEMNRLPKVYHHGQISDITQVVESVPHGMYQEIFLIGFSMGGSHTTKYLCSAEIPDSVKAGIAFSVSYDMEDSLKEIHKPNSKIYHDRFLQKLLLKAKSVQNNHPGTISCNLNEIQTFADYHKYVTLPLNNFRTEDEFHFDASPKNFIQDLQRPLLMVNALNDPILGPECYPNKDESNNLVVYNPKFGGHLGFNYPFSPRSSFMEKMSWEFISRITTI